jgi:hypothetical protein
LSQRAAFKGERSLIYIKDSLIPACPSGVTITRYCFT